MIDLDPEKIDDALSAPRYADDRRLGGEANSALGASPKAIRIALGERGGFMVVWPKGSATFRTAAEVAAFLIGFQVAAGEITR